MPLTLNVAIFTRVAHPDGPAADERQRRQCVTRSQWGRDSRMSTAATRCFVVPAVAADGASAAAWRRHVGVRRCGAAPHCRYALAALGFAASS
jgi:hypothetical protein